MMVQSPPISQGSATPQFHTNGVDVEFDGSNSIKVKSVGLRVAIYSSKANKFSSAADQAKYVHLNVDIVDGIPNEATGIFAELAGTRMLSEATAALLKPPKAVALPTIDGVFQCPEWCSGYTWPQVASLAPVNEACPADSERIDEFGECNEAVKQLTGRNYGTPEYCFAECIPPFNAKPGGGIGNPGYATNPSTCIFKGPGAATPADEEDYFFLSPNDYEEMTGNIEYQLICKS